ncbi:MAG TPA: hypothetical protein VG820_06990 [Fimbriimonadaceae bacterium]|nr:hypothetical protein [Fimbriimonadaceae bacterium]
MKKWIVVILCVFALTGCKGLKDAQLEAYVGDSQTKIVYKNVGKAASKIPDDRKVFFRSIDQATDAGYTQSNVADSGDKSDE